MTAHLGDDAALYALGALDAREAAAVEAHLRECETCLKEVAAAEDDVARIVASQPQHAAPRALENRVRRIFEAPRAVTWARTPAWSAFGAVAAALLIGLLPSLWLWNENRSMSDALAQQSAAINRVATTPHLTAEFNGMPQPSKAMVMYGPSGAWYVIVVRNASKTLRVAWMHDGTQTMLGDAVAHDGMAMLYLPKSHRMEQLALMDGSQVVAQAALRYE